MVFYCACKGARLNFYKRRKTTKIKQWFSTLFMSRTPIISSACETPEPAFDGIYRPTSKLKCIFLSLG